MPEISRYFGIVIRMYFRDHVPPHFHAAYGRMEAKVFALVVEWGRIHQKELLDNWRRLQASEAPRRMVPLHPRITAVRVAAHLIVDLTFTDGSHGTVDLTSGADLDPDMLFEAAQRTSAKT